MTAQPVDVLAIVLDASATAKQRRSAHAAITELIKASSAAVVRSEGLHAHMTREGLAVRNRVKFAVARCGAAK